MSVFTEIELAGETLPVAVIRGSAKGPRVLVTAGIHGCEFVGIETARRLAIELAGRSGAVRGTVTIVACVNPGAMRARIPALNPADGLNINRMFPGDASGSASRRIAAWLMELQSESDFYIDMHGGDVHEKLSPYVYIPGACEERVTAAARRAAAFVNVPVRILSSALSGAYNSAAACGTPSILIERGQGGRWSEAEVAEYRADILSVLAHLGTVDGANFAGVHGPVGQTEMRAFYETSEGGFWYPCVEPGERIAQGAKLGEMLDIEGRLLREVTAVKDGVVLYMTGTLYAPAGFDLVAY